jgi:hypothetical protein
MFTKQIMVAEIATGLVFGPYGCVYESDASFHYAMDKGMARVRSEDVELSQITMEDPDVTEARRAAYSLTERFATPIQDRYSEFTSDRARTDAQDTRVRLGVN